MIRGIVNRLPNGTVEWRLLDENGNTVKLERAEDHPGFDKIMAIKNRQGKRLFLVDGVLMMVPDDYVVE